MMDILAVSEYLLVVGSLLTSANLVYFVYRVFICRDALLKNEGRRLAQSVFVLVLLVLLCVQFGWAYTSEAYAVWMGFPLFLISLLLSVGFFWAFGQLRSAEERTITILESMVGVIEAGDANLDGHSLHVRNLTLLLYENLPLTERLFLNPRNLECAALLLDVGKLGVPRTIIDKTGKLDAHEWELVRRHPQLAVHILEPIPSFKTISTWIQYHHERVDGTGYYQLKGDDIPLASRIISVADTFSALTMERSYKATMTYEDAIAELRQAAGTQLDARLVEIFCNIPVHIVEASVDDTRRKMQRYQEGDFR